MVAWEVNRQEQLDVISLILRLEQIEKEDQPTHWLWDTRVIECDVPRLKRYITNSDIINLLGELTTL